MINKLKIKIYIIISIGEEKLFDKTQRPFLIKTLYKLEKEGNFLDLIKSIYKTPITNIVLNS